MAVRKTIHPLTGEPSEKRNGHAREELLNFFASQPRRSRHPIEAKYDAAQNSDEFKYHWANADRFDADSANSRTVRESLVPRSRYEISNNGYADGIVQTYATDLVGVGPKLRMQTASEGFNRLVERTWQRWAKRILFRRKLWTMAHAKVQDGEAFGVIRTNPGVRHPVQLDVVLFETEQCQTPALPFEFDPFNGYIDGIKFDRFGNPEWYDVLPYHPGSEWGGLVFDNPEQVPAQFMMHWFKMRRPGQHRQVPELTSTLNVGAAARRWREATVGAAETAAEFSVLLSTAFQPDEMDTVSPMSTLDIQKRMMTALPQGWSAEQMRAEHPTREFQQFNRSLINEQARPKSMPFNKAAADSSDYNYASGRLDHQTYYAELDVEREDCNDLVLDPLFELWWEEAVQAFGWLNGRPEDLEDVMLRHSWDWPKHRVADIEAEANANDKKLRNGSVSLSSLYAESGMDFQEELEKMAIDYGVSTDEMRMILLKNNFAGALAAPAQLGVQNDGE